MTKKKRLSSLLENVDENEPGLIKALRYADYPNKAIWILKKYELLLKGENKKMVRMVGKQGELLKKVNESDFFIM